MIVPIFVCLIYGAKTAYLSYKTPATGSSHVYTNYATKATDGNDSTAFTNSFQSGLYYQSWIKVDLLNEHNVTSVTIINMANKDNPTPTAYLRMEDSEIRIGSDYDSLDTSLKCGKSVTNTQIVTSPIIDVVCQHSITGRYVMLWFPTKTQYLSVSEMKVYAEHEHVTAFKKSLNPVSVWMLDYECLLQYFSGTTMFRLCGNTNCALEISQPVDWTMKMNTYLIKDIQALTITFYLCPYQNSIGNIVRFGNDQRGLRLEQTYSNGILYQSEVTVYYESQILTRAPVLLPEVWTFLGLTFDGINKNIKLWRNGEIASIGYTNFTQLNVNGTEVKIGGDGSELQARVALLQVFDRVLDETEIKIARDRPINGHNGLFEKLMPVECFVGHFLNSGVARSLTQCAMMCFSKCCDVFGFARSDKMCLLYSTLVRTETFVVINGVENYQKVSLV